MQLFSRLCQIIKTIKMTRPVLMAFDFDNTIINENSDIVVCDLIPGEIPAEIKAEYNKGGWIAYMRAVLKLAHKEEISKDKIMNSVLSIQEVKGMENLLRNLHSHNCEIIIISDANSVFINEWLEQKKLSSVIKKVFTNPAWFEDNGLLTVREYHDQDWCKLSERNLCKGYALENYIKERNNEGVTFGKVAYVGDGTNDFCPILRLSEKDIAFPREDYPIIKSINNPKDSKNVVKAEVIPWAEGNDIWEALKSRINL